MKAKRKQRLLYELLELYERREHDFPVIDKHGNTHYPVQNANGIVVREETQPGWPTGYRGYALEINDHGNVTLWSCYRNGNNRELASVV